MFSELQVAHKEYWYCRFRALLNVITQNSKADGNFKNNNVNFIIVGVIL
jgi:hypothetical protein